MNKQTYKERPRREVLAFMAGLCVAANEYRSAEGYLLELLAFLAFAERDESEVYSRA